MTYLKYLNIGCEIQFSQDFSLPGLLDFTAEEELGHKQGNSLNAISWQRITSTYNHTRKKQRASSC